MPVITRGLPWKNGAKKLQAHRHHWQALYDTWGIPALPLDSASGMFTWGRKFHVNKHSFCHGQPSDDLDLSVYTDGSNFRGNTGCGFAIFRQGTEIHRESVYLGKLATVFQAEVLAIKLASDYILSMGLNALLITFYVDSQSALLALEQRQVRSKLVLECIESLNILGRETQVSLRWIAAHVGHAGNELADELAKLGTLNIQNVQGPEPIIPVAPSVLRHYIMTALENQWTHLWQERPDCRQTKIWFPVIDRLKSAKLVNLNRFEFSLVVHLITGHNFLNRHCSILDPSVDPDCRLCMEADETSLHIIADCPALAGERHRTFGEFFLEAPLYWSPYQISAFLREHSIRSLFGQEEG